MFVSTPLLFAHCLPSDFVNPFLPWRIPLAICTALLLAATFALARIYPADQRARFQTLIATIVVMGALAVTVVAALIWGAGLSYISWCSPGDSQQLEFQALLAQAAPIIVCSTVGVTAVLLALLLVVLSVRLFSLRGGRYVGR